MKRDLQVMKHPLVDYHLTALRDKHTAGAGFRQAIKTLSMLLAYEATADLETSTHPVETPLVTCDGYQLNCRVGLVPILRAGVAMVEPMLDLIPASEVWHLGMYRDEATAQPVHYYSKLPDGKPVDIAFVLDPMLATGGSALMAIEALKKWGVAEIRMLAIIAAPEGIARLQKDCPEVQVHACVVDQRLNEDYFIVPGLGDAGDRIFNTVG